MEAVKQEIYDFLFDCKNNIVFYKLNGNSLSETNLRHGSLIAVDTGCEAKHLDFIVAKVKDSTIVKQLFNMYGVTVLLSKHKGSKNYVIDRSKFKIIGVVKYVINPPLACGNSCF